VLFDVIFVSLFVAGWLVCAFLPWLVVSVATRGNAGLANLPLCLFAGLVAALAVPVLGFNGAGGLRMSFVAAVVVPSLLLGVRRFSMSALPAHRAAHKPAPEEIRPE